MDLLEIDMLEQLLYFFHHGIEPFGQKAELVFALGFDPYGIILLLQSLETADQLFDRHLYLYVQQIGDEGAGDQQKDHRAIEQRVRLMDRF
ncbi:hypothetical protein D1872_302780 [compost metagenome]